MEPTPYIKYPRTWHLPFSPGAQSDDKLLTDCEQFVGRRVICTAKLDGENTAAYSDGHIHARSIDSRGGEDRAWVKKFLTENVCGNLPEGWRVCGENLWAQHSIAYDDLTSYFYGFSLWTERNFCLSWDETLEYFELLGITPVPVLYDGPWDEAVVRKLVNGLDTARCEGLVVRVADSFCYNEFKSSVAKWVRAGHVQVGKHWRHQQLTPNKLRVLA
jgi:hypothetical protein